MYRVIGVPAEGLVRLESFQYGKQLWTRAKTRKKFRCQMCTLEKIKGTIAFAPLTHGYNRMHRICQVCVDKKSAELLPRQDAR